MAEVGFGEGEGFRDVGDSVVMFGRRTVLFGELDQRGGEVEAVIFSLGIDLAAQDALATSQVQEGRIVL